MLDMVTVKSLAHAGPEAAAKAASRPAMHNAAFAPILVKPSPFLSGPPVDAPWLTKGSVGPAHAPGQGGFAVRMQVVEVLTRPAAGKRQVQIERAEGPRHADPPVILVAPPIAGRQGQIVDP